MRDASRPLCSWVIEASIAISVVASANCAEKPSDFLIVIAEGLPEEALPGDGDGRPAQPFIHESAQAGADRLADQQGPGKYGHGDGHAGDDGQVRAPVVAEAAENERAW